MIYCIFNIQNMENQCLLLKMVIQFQFLIHGVHHVYPNDPLRLVMPPLLSGPIMLIAMSIIYLIFGAPFMWHCHFDGFVIHTDNFRRAKTNQWDIAPGKQL